LSKDQLDIQRKEVGLLEEFSEGQIQFNPTYKFDKVSGKYDSERLPAFTDRILFVNNQSIQILKYEAFHQYLSSDHKPVCLKHFNHSIRLVQFSKLL
jgi:hypothetical protein